MRLLKGMLLVVVLVFGFDAMAREVPIQDFFKDPEFTSISLSPDGNFLRPSDDGQYLAMRVYADRQPSEAMASAISTTT